MKKVNPVAIGGFMIGSLALCVLFIVFFSSSDVFKEKHEFVAFFSGSVKGLSVGSPVLFRGVPVGQVKSIQLLLSGETTDTVWIPVVFEVKNDSVVNIDSWKVEDPEKYVQRLIDGGLRAKLIVSSLVTGQLTIMLDFYPDEPAHYFGKVKTIQEIPTTISDMEKFEAILEGLNLRDLVAEATQSFAHVNELLSSPGLEKGVENFGDTMENAEAISRKLNKAVDPLVASLETTLKEFEKSGKGVGQPVRDVLEQAKVTLEEFHAVVKDGNAMNYRITTVLDEMSNTLRAFRQLAEALERNPESLIRGNPDER